MFHPNVDFSTFDGPEIPLRTKPASSLVERKKARPAFAGRAVLLSPQLTYTSRKDSPDASLRMQRRPFGVRRHRTLHSPRRTARTSTVFLPQTGDETCPGRYWRRSAYTLDTSHGRRRGDYRTHIRICMSPCFCALTARRTTGWTCTCHPHRGSTPAARHGRPPCQRGNR